MATPYNPGHVVRRDYALDQYKPFQEVRYQAIAQAYYALYGGKLETLRPTPGFSYDPARFVTWKGKFLAGQKQETASRGKHLARPLDEDDYPPNVWLWLYQRMLVAQEMVDKANQSLATVTGL